MKDERSQAEGVDLDLLVIVIDTKVGFSSRGVEDTFPFYRCLDSIEALANSHLAMSSNNIVCILGCHSTGNRFLYPSEDGIDYAKDIKQTDGRFETFSAINLSLKTEFLKLMNTDKGSSGDDRNVLDFPIAGTLTRALCYINRIAKSKKAVEKLKSRILVITNGGESAAQYMTFMNVFFTCQKNSVLLDACVIGEDSNLLQQGCDITGGIYIKIPQPSGLLEYLLWLFLPSIEERKNLNLPPPSKIDYRAACFCHRQLVEVGYVCSVCLSIFCRTSPVCVTCYSIFKGATMQQPKSKKKRALPPGLIR
ncbi:general transcription factor IIH subunit 3-like [Artemia franciscana]|uniref:general transcription factor IIH subunit 3-like n=1 Tax=Artemia franciscana TaxID=6661 RepID=UPI0032DA8394